MYLHRQVNDDDDDDDDEARMYLRCRMMLSGSVECHSLTSVYTTLQRQLPQQKRRRR